MVVPSVSADFTYELTWPNREALDQFRLFFVSNRAKLDQIRISGRQGETEKIRAAAALKRFGCNWR